jgi:CBS-domain-containing membrane protein
MLLTWLATVIFRMVYPDYPEGNAGWHRGVRAADVMTKFVVSTETDTGYTEAMELFAQHKVGAMPVLSGNRVAGCVTLRDMVPGKRVGQCMRSNCHTVEEDAPLDLVLEILTAQHADRVVVLGKDCGEERVRGIITADNILYGGGAGKSSTGFSAQIAG